MGIIIFQAVITLWYERNDVQHADSYKKDIESRKRLVCSELKAIYENKHLYLQRDKEFLFESYERHNEHHYTHIESWLIVNRERFRQSIRLAKKYALAGTASITSFLSRPPTASRKKFPDEQSQSHCNSNPSEMTATSQNTKKKHSLQSKLPYRRILTPTSNAGIKSKETSNSRPPRKQYLQTFLSFMHPKP